MADRNTPAAATFEEWRVEFNELATDVGDINNLPSTINGQSVTDVIEAITQVNACLLYTSPSPRDREKSRMPSSA